MYSVATAYLSYDTDIMNIKSKLERHKRDHRCNGSFFCQECGRLRREIYKIEHKKYGMGW